MGRFGLKTSAVIRRFWPALRCPMRTRPKTTVALNDWSTRFVLAKSLLIQLRQASTNLSYVLDKGPDEVTKRQLLVSEIKPQDELSPPGDLT